MKRSLQLSAEIVKSPSQEWIVYEDMKNIIAKLKEESEIHYSCVVCKIKSSTHRLYANHLFVELGVQDYKDPK